MTPEERLIYNKAYYAKNKLRITESMLNKTTCELCNCVISLSNLDRHKISTKCKRKHLEAMYAEQSKELLLIKEQVANLSGEMANLKIIA